jgi:potassium voltage-gated channel Eag-related subfamily H protein 7
MTTVVVKTKKKLSSRLISSTNASITPATTPSYTRSTQIQIDDGFFAIQDPGTFILNPDSFALKTWDGVIIILLFYTALVTPFEVALLETKFDGLWVVNRLVDLLFVVDMFKNFVTALKDDGGMWIVSNMMIAKSYLRAWFLIDLLSIIPVDSIGLIIGSDTSKFKALRIIRLLRLMKLLRIIRAARILKRWEARMDISYGTLSLIKFGLITFIVGHWLACLFRMIPDFEGQENNWITVYYGVDSMEKLNNEVNFMDQYITAFYWSWATITTIGYGDVISITPFEKILGIVCMVIGAGVYAYIVGGVCGVIANKDLATSKFYQLMDDMNLFMSEHGVPSEVKVKMRSFQINCRELTRQEQFHAAVDSLTPMLRGELMQHTSLKWINKIKIFELSPEGERTAFMQAIAAHMAPRAFSENEIMLRQQDPLQHMLCIQRGMASKIISGTIVKLLGRDTVVGEELMLFDQRRSMCTIRAMTFVLAYGLGKAQFMSVLESWEFQETKKKVRWELCRRVFQERFKIYAFTFKEVCGKEATFNQDSHKKTLQALHDKHAFNYHNFSQEDLERSQVKNNKFSAGSVTAGAAFVPLASAPAPTTPALASSQVPYVGQPSATTGSKAAWSEILADFQNMNTQIRTDLDRMDARIRQAVEMSRYAASSSSSNPTPTLEDHLDN